MNTSDIPRTDPVPIAPETWLVPNLVGAQPGTYLAASSLLVRGAEPIILDTGAPLHRHRWLEQMFSLVEPEDDVIAVVCFAREHGLRIVPQRTGQLRPAR